MQTHFERITDTLYLRHEIYRAVTRSVFAAFPGDLSVLAEPEHLERACDLCLAGQEHTLQLHLRTLPPTADMLAATRLIAALPWPTRTTR